MQKKTVPKKILQDPRPTNRVDYIQDDRLRLEIPVGPRFQADISDWTTQHNEKTLKDRDMDTLKFMGTRIWPHKGRSQATEQERLKLSMDVIGKGRADFCPCEFPGSAECIERHVADKRNKLQLELGPAFWIWKFNEMGVDVSKLWTLEEQQKFEDILKMNPTSQGIPESLIPMAEEISSQEDQALEVPNVPSGVPTIAVETLEIPPETHFTTTEAPEVQDVLAEVLEAVEDIPPSINVPTKGQESDLFNAILEEARAEIRDQGIAFRTRATKRAGQVLSGDDQTWPARHAGKRATPDQVRATKRAGKEIAMGGPSTKRKQKARAKLDSWPEDTWSFDFILQSFSEPTPQIAGRQARVFKGIDAQCPPYEEFFSMDPKDSGLMKDAPPFAAEPEGFATDPAIIGSMNSLSELPREDLYHNAKEALRRIAHEMLVGLSLGQRFVADYERRLVETEATLKELKERSQDSIASIQAETTVARETARLAREDAVAAHSERRQLRTNWEASLRAQEVVEAENRRIQSELKVFVAAREAAESERRRLQFELEAAESERRRLQFELEAALVARSSVEAELQAFRASLAEIKAKAVEEFRHGPAYRADMKKVYLRSVSDTTVDVATALQAKLDRYAQRHGLDIRANLLLTESSGSEAEDEEESKGEEDEV